MKSTSRSCIEVLLGVAVGGTSVVGSRQTPTFEESVRARGGSHRASKRHMRDPARRRGGFDLVVRLEALESVPEAYASAEQDRHHDDVHVVDEPRGNEVPDHGGASADAYVLTVRSIAGGLERLRGRSIDEVERRAALHLDRWPRVMGEDEDRRVERRVGTPPPPPLPGIVPSPRG